VLPERKILILKKEEAVEIEKQDLEEYNIELNFDKKTEQPVLVFTKKEPVEKKIKEPEPITEKREEKKVKKEPESISVSEPEITKTILIDETDNILFEYNRSFLTRHAKRILDRIGRSLKKEKPYMILIQGHTDDKGDEQFNMRLSEARARRVATYLINKKYIDQDRVVYEGKGEAYPVADNSTELGQKKNRRVEIIFLQ